LLLTFLIFTISLFVRVSLLVTTRDTKMLWLNFQKLIKLFLIVFSLLSIRLSHWFAFQLSLFQRIWRRRRKNILSLLWGLSAK
jgi:hypothetical protein